MRRAALFLTAFALLTLSPAAMAQPTPGQARPEQATPGAAAPLPLLSPIFADNMVLQRGKPDTLWGWSDPGDTVRVQFGTHTASAVAGPDRRWQLRIEPPATGGPYTLTVTGSHATATLNNVLVGDVWLCGGQSNMGLPLRFTANAEAVAKSANLPEIRFFEVAAHSAYHPTPLVAGTWKVVSPETAGSLSAVAFYFARKLQSEIHVPIGLVVDAVGGTPAEAWTSASALRPMHDFDVPLDELAKLQATPGTPEYGNYILHWYDQYDLGQQQHWADPTFNDSTWKTVPVPGGFAQLGVPDTPAVVWFRREITLPDPIPPGRAAIFLGSIERMDTVYINGTSVGASAWVENPRVYPIPAGLLKPGRNLIAIRVLKTKPDGGFLGKPADLHLTLGDKTSIPLAGEWKAKLSVDARLPHPMPLGYENWPVMPTVLYQGMLAPVAPLSLTGAIWYQGEQNSERGYQYRKLLPVMIADWRQLFGQGNFPFYIVQLPEFKPHSATPVDDDWAETRESQAIAAASVPNSCLAVTIDTGDPANLHPKEKQPVGDRLALCALALHFGKHVPYSGPTLASVDRLPSEIRLHFNHTDGGLVAKGGKLQEFAIAGADHKWVFADARIVGDTVVVSSPAVPHPLEVRYAWQGDPDATLFNGAGLPAGPFRTDTWPGVTESHRPY